MKLLRFMVQLFSCFLLVTGCRPTLLVDKNRSSNSYLAGIKADLQKQWPNNRTINLVFHGHSVPAGYFKTPDVRPFDAYPLLSLKKIKELYPYAVITVINTSIGGENSVAGARRFDTDVLVHQPDIVFIDYAINDAGLDLADSKKAWEEMIEKCLARNIRVILLTPSPNLKVDINDPADPLYQHSEQVILLAEKYKVGLADSYGAFRRLHNQGKPLGRYMSQFNHPNKKGHEVIANEIFKWF
jgi:acyl-CoA thioesterase-1